MNNSSSQSFNNVEISETEIAPDKIMILHYNPKTTDAMKIKESLSDLNLPCMQTIIIPNDIEIAQMTPKQAEWLLSDLQEVLKEICQNEEIPLTNK